MVLNLKGLVNGQTQKKTVTLGEYIHECVQTGCKGTEADKQKKEAEISAKIRRGARLNAQEMRFVQENMPEMYPAVLRQQRLRELALHAFERCRSKEEVAKTEQQLMHGISENDPNREMMVAAIESAKKEFQATQAYKELPETDEEKKEHPAKNERISYEVSENGYQTAYVIDAQKTTQAG